MNCRESLTLALSLSVSSQPSDVMTANTIITKLKEEQPVELINELINIIAQPSDDLNSNQTKLIASITLKTFLSAWYKHSTLDAETTKTLYTNAIKAFMNIPITCFEYMVDIMNILFVPNKVLENSEALESVFPLIPHTLEKKDWRMLAYQAKIINVLFSVFEKIEITTPVLAKLKQLLLAYQEVVLKLIVSITQLDFTTNEDQIRCLCYLFDTVSSILEVDLPEYFEDNLQGIISLILSVLSRVSVSEDDSVFQPTLMLNLATSVLIVVDKLVGKFTEEIEQYVKFLFNAVIHVLSILDNRPLCDKTAVAAIKVLISMSRYKWSGDNSILPGKFDIILNNAVLPNITLSECDIDELETNGISYARCDLECVQSSQRRVVIEQLLKNILDRYPELIINVSVIAQEKLSNKKHLVSQLEQGMFLVSCCLVQTSARTTGATQFRDDNAARELLSMYIIPILLSEDQNLLLLTAALKLLIQLRNLIVNDEVVKLFCVLSGLLDKLSKDFDDVKLAYVCSCIEVFLTKNHLTGRNFLEFSTNASHNNILLENSQKLLSFLNATNDNEYLVKCLCRIQAVASIPIETQLLTIDKLLTLISSMKNDNFNPKYLHCLFNCVELVIQRISKNELATAETLEKIHSLIYVTLMKQSHYDDYVELRPYFYQLIASLILSLPQTIEGSVLQNNKQSVNVIVDLYSNFLSTVSRSELWNVSPAHATFLAFCVRSYIEKTWLWESVKNINLCVVLDQFLLIYQNPHIKVDEIVNFLATVLFYLPNNVLRQNINVLLKLLTSTTNYRYVVCVNVLIIKFDEAIAFFTEDKTKFSKLCQMYSSLLANAMPVTNQKFVLLGLVKVLLSVKDNNHINAIIEHFQHSSLDNKIDVKQETLDQQFEIVATTADQGSGYANSLLNHRFDRPIHRLAIKLLADQSVLKHIQELKNNYTLCKALESISIVKLILTTFSAY